ncbi:DUF4249 domain-containing protein [Spirosoma montaniterrae]|uniref:DUF4249 domain-containing protein n=1 Tax=Spirosoma montaniterrae TaxID=1178516 RepID=A0A1P9WVX2_9BACT|nr:DUF4249 domain-containing protein [Spirosoma montaniterrae]AQG79513.1 hypothetical protein AWR27_09385 [Spirosoma montaniterrae]
MNKLLIACLCVLLMTCVQEVQLPIRQVDRRLVVEGLLTNEPFPWVRLTYSGRYNSNNPSPPQLVVNDALVVLQDDLDRSVRLLPDPFALSYYTPRDSTFRGEVGRTYTLYITLPDGTRYESRPERLNPVPVLEPLRATLRQGVPETGQPDFYDIRIDTQDSPTPGNYYRWSALGWVRRWVQSDPKNPRIPCNTCSCWIPDYGPPGDVLSDALINGNRITQRLVYSLPVLAIAPQYVQVEQFSITQAAYQYWTLFEQQRTRTGSLFDAQPASIEGNVRAVNDTTIRALGFWGASAVSRRRITIAGDTINYDRFLVRYGKLFILPTGDCFSNFSNPILVPPRGWPAR